MGVLDVNLRVLFLGLLVLLVGFNDLLAKSSTLSLEKASTLWGPPIKRDGDWIIVQGRRTFPRQIRTALVAPAQRDWHFSVEVKSLYNSSVGIVRRSIRDLGIQVGDGAVTVWFGSENTRGIRIKSFGRVLASKKVFAISEGVTIGVGRSREQFVAFVNGVPVMEVSLPAELTSGPIDLISRNSPEKWRLSKVHELRYTAAGNLKAGGHNVRPSGPKWSEVEAISFGYQPVKSHLWDRWTASYRLPASAFEGYPYIDGGRSDITHGPLLGRVSKGGVRAFVVSKARTQAWLVARRAGDTGGKWRRLAPINWSDGPPYRGTADILDPEPESTLNLSVEIDGRVLDVRALAGRWPVLRRRWFSPNGNTPFRLGVVYCDNYYPSERPIISDAWIKRAADMDLVLHLGDFVYEQSYRRRPEVSRLDYLKTMAPGEAVATRQMLVPTVAVFDDHELYNDITATAEYGRFADSGVGTIRADWPWGTASRDAGRLSWERYVGWSTPTSRPPVSGIGSAEITQKGHLKILSWQGTTPLKGLDVTSIASLIIFPENAYSKGVQLKPYDAGVYRLKSVSPSGELVEVDSPLKETGKLISFGLSGPRYEAVDAGVAELLLLDLRSERTLWDLDPYAQGNSMLGPNQRAWLLERIAQSKKKVLLIASSNTVSIHNGKGTRKRDSWTGYRWERDLILDALEKRDGLTILLTGDIHASAMRKISSKVYEFLSGPWNAKGYCGRAIQMDDMGPSRQAETLWAANMKVPDCEWQSRAGFVTVDPNGDVLLEILDHPTQKILYTHRIEATTYTKQRD